MSVIAYGGAGGAYEWSGRAFPKSSVHASSLATTPLEVLDTDGNRFTHGTGFAVRFGESVYLVSAWHVVTGRDFFTGKLNPQGLIPRALRFFIPQFHQVGNVLNIKSEGLTFDLNNKALEILATPPRPFGFPVDVAVAKLPLSTEKSGSFTSVGLNEFKWGIAPRATNPIQSMIGADVFVLGYPLGTYDGIKTPIWKRGAIASEPLFEISPKGAFLLDVNSAGGMSGGPILRRVATFSANNIDMGIVQEFYDEMLIGVYSGRALSASEGSFVLGYGWPIDMVYKIIETGLCYSGPE